MNKPKPRFQLETPSRFLGGYKYNRKHYDLFEFLGEGKFPTLGARFGDDEQDCLVGIPDPAMITKCPKHPLVEAYRRSSLYPCEAYTRAFNRQDQYYGRYTYKNEVVRVFDLYVRGDQKVYARFGNNELDVIACSLEEAEFIGSINPLHPWAEAYNRWKFWNNADLTEKQLLTAAS